MPTIQNIDPTCTRLSHEGKEYEGREGLFDVPPEVASALVSFPHWRHYDGNPWPHPKTAEEIEAEKTADLVERVLSARGEAPAAPTRRHPRRSRE